MAKDMERQCTRILLTVYLMCVISAVSEASSSQYPWGRVTSGEYCDFESFDAACRDDEVIVIGTATFGHMELGRCVEFDTGQLGCQSDVTQILNELCSGKQKCAIPVIDESLRATDPCRRGVILYLQASYSCVKVIQSQKLCQKIPAQPQPSYIASSQAAKAPCTKATGLFTQEFTITALQGQKLTFSLINLAKLFNTDTRDQTAGQELGYVLDSESDAIDPIVLQDQMESEIVVSRRHQASVFLSSSPPAPFLISFQVSGCPDLKLASDVWLKRDGDKTTVGCHQSKQSWQLRCHGNQWIGVIGNCTLASPRVASAEISKEIEWTLPLPKDIIFVIIGCATLFVAILVVTVGYVCLKWPSENKRQMDKSTLRYRGINHMKLNSTGTESDIVYLTPRYTPEGNTVVANTDYQPIWEKPLPQLPNNDQPLLGVTTKKNNEDPYNMSLSSNSTDYERKKYYVLDKDYVMNANGQA